MKAENIVIALTASVLLTGVVLKVENTPDTGLITPIIKTATPEKPCVFMSVMGEQPDRKSVV